MNFKHDLIDDSKKLSKIKREELSKIIKENSIAYSIQFIDSGKIDEVNILNATTTIQKMMLDNISISDKLRSILTGDGFESVANKILEL